MINPRNLALSVLEKINKEDCFSHIAIKRALDENRDMDSRDKALVKRLVEGCIERQIELDYIISLYSKTKPNKLKPIIREILRMGIYQILYMDTIPDSAACNEAVKLVQKRGLANLKGFVNGVLRNISREKDDIKYPSKETDRRQYLSVKYSCPLWLIDMWDEELTSQSCKGEGAGNFVDDIHAASLTGDSCNDEAVIECDRCSDIVEQVLASFLESRPVTIRHRVSYEVNAEQLCGDNLWENLELGTDITALDEFQNGDITVQDRASIQAVLCAGINKGDTVIDVCAAPGGKSLFASELTGPEGHVLGFDLSEKKIPIMNQNKARMKAANTEFAVGDASKLNAELINKGDVVICDVPCSGLGVIGKKRDIKYKADLERIEGLLPIQKAILDNVCNYVKPGGTLVYSTCTISKRENIDQVESFLKNHEDFYLDSIEEYVADDLKKGNAAASCKQGYIQILPTMGNIDGFFIARLRRR